MSELYQTLNATLMQSPSLALLAAFAWGVCSMLFSPCHLAGIPLVIAYVNGQETRSVRHAAGLSTLFAAGMLLMIALIGGATALAGRAVGDISSAGYYVVAVVFIFIGLDLLDVVSLPWFGAQKEKVKAKGAYGALLLGLIFGLASGPCTFAFLAPILAITFQTATSNAGFGALLLVSFGIGHCLIITLAGTSAESAKRLADWNRETKTACRVKMVFGILLILAGLYFLYRAI
ncbi:MAG: cytochrome c biogenesis protein CcdA [Verrucomicrobiota bacterium]